MDEGFFGLLAVLLVLGIVAMPIVSVVMLAGIRRRLRDMAGEQERLSAKLDVIERGGGVDAAKPDAPIAYTKPPVAVVVPIEEKTAPPVQPVPPPLAPAVPVPPPPPEQRAPEPEPERPIVPPAPPKGLSPVRQILARIWQWILMGGEERAQGVTREFAIASWWLLIVGIVAVVACVGYFLKWSIERELIGPAGRVAVSVVVALGMLVAGMRLLGKKYHLIGQGLLGGGLLTLYFSVYAAGSMYSLIPITVAFALMILVTLTAGVLSVKTGSLLVAVLGLAGGYLTPVMLRTPDPNLTVFYAYLLLLSIGIMAVARFRDWRILNVLAFVLTYALFIGSMDVYKRADFPVALTFLSAFFVVHSWIVTIRMIAQRKPSTVLETIHLTANAGMMALMGYHLIVEAHGRPYPALLSLGLAVFYMLHVWAFLAKRLTDRRLLVTLIALAGVFTTWTLPLVMEKESLTIAISLLAFMFLWLGGQLRSAFVQNLGHVLYGVVFFRLLWWDLPRNFGGHAGAVAPMSDYWEAMLDRLWTFGMSIGSVAAAFVLERRRRRSLLSLTVPEQADTPRVVPASVASRIFYWFVALFGFLFVYMEMDAMLAYGETFRLPVLTVLWCTMAGYFLYEYLRGEGGSRVMLAALWVFLAAAAIKIFAFDLASWDFDPDDWVCGMAYAPLIVTARLIDFGAVMALMLTAWWMVGVRRESRAHQTVLGYGALVLFFVYASLETNSFLYWKMRSFQEGGLSSLWALFAIAFIAGGIWKNLRPLRYGGLALFAVVVAKVFLVDLSDMEVIHRVIAFMIVGLALLLGSFAYIFAGKKFERK